MITYRATLDVPGELAAFTAGLLAAERRRRKTPRGSRALGCYGQAVLGLRWFRDRARPDALARDHHISRATAYRYLDEVITVLAAAAPQLPAALDRAARDGLTHVILDGKLFRTDRCHEKTTGIRGRDIDLWYSGKARAHGANIQAVTTPGGFPLWVSPAEPGSIYDLTAARIHALPALRRAAATGLPTLADAGYTGAGTGIAVPAKQPSWAASLPLAAQTRNALLRSLRCLGERGFALLTQRWRALQHITASPSKTGDIARAALVLTHYEHGYSTRSLR